MGITAKGNARVPNHPMMQKIDSKGCTDVDGECASGPADPSERICDRVARMESEQAKLRRELMLAQDRLADIDAFLRQFQPLLVVGFRVQSVLRSVATLAARANKAVAEVRPLAKRLKEARLRSERLVKNSRHGKWTSKLDRWTYLSNASRAIGLSTPAYLPV